MILGLQRMKAISHILQCLARLHTEWAFFYGSYLNHSDCEDTASKARLIFVNKAWHWDLGDVVSIPISIPDFIFSLKFVS